MSDRVQRARRTGILDLIYRLLFTGQLREQACSHLNLIQAVSPTTDVCQDCLVLGDTWPALRMCMICGYIGCCDDAKNQHARKHYEETGHPIIQALGRFQDWQWCYIDNALLVPRRLAH